MKNPFLKLGTQRTDLRTFLEDTSYNSMKYSGESGVKNIIYFPYREEPDAETGEMKKELIAISAGVHNWDTYENGKRGFHSVICTEGSAYLADNEGNVLSDGICPICARLRDAKAITDYRIALLDNQYGGVPTDERQKKRYDDDVDAIKKDQKVKFATQYMYILVAVMKLTKDGNGKLVPATMVDGLPAYQFKIWRAGRQRVEQLREKLADESKAVTGAEVKFSHPEMNGTGAMVKMKLMSDMEIDLVSDNNSLLKKFPKLQDKIQSDVKNIEDTVFDTIEKSFPEWKMSYKENLVLEMDKLFSAWDEYQKELSMNPSAKYLEYAATGKAVTNPAVAVGSAQSAPIGGMAMIGDVPQMEAMPQLAVAESELVSGDGIAEI